FHAIPSKIQAEKAPGNLYVEVKKVDGFQHTLTAWESKKHLRDFVYSSPHNKAFKAFTSIAHGKTCHFKTKKFPSWDYALEYWKAHGKEY
ncbi:MAG: DUF3291 domain-containing protein, partial [Flavobacteriaceae bacterium]|nr:DUF3291 domain-containing protein [Flavobacteriaceae bacterium]